MVRKTGQKDTGIMSEEVKKLISQIPTAEDFLKEVEKGRAKKKEEPVLGFDENYDICGNPYNVEPEKTEERADISDGLGTKEAVGGDCSGNIGSASSDFGSANDDISENSDIFWESMNEWNNEFLTIEKHMDKMFCEFRYVTAAVDRFSINLSKSKAELDELERQVGAISALTRVLANRVNIMCENGIRDMNSQLDIIKMKRCY